ncbi:protein kinase family protein [Actinomycetes bacterium KLBMP 9797]
MTQVGEGQEASESAPSVMTFGPPTVGEVLAERYELVEHINDDSAGRQVWRGIDVILRRPVAVVLRYPGGDSATEMLKAAVDASRVIHPSLVGVYDAIDEADRAYVVREWVDGRSLREMVASGGPLDPARATTVAHAISEAVAAIHATDMVHGNIHPGTALIGDDGRVVLADARADNADTPETDIRAIGGILYFALTGHWPQAELGQSTLPDAVRDGGGAIAAPRQARAGVPAYLDDLTMDLLDKRLAVPAADVLAAELGRLDNAGDEPYFEEAGPLRLLAGGGGAGAAVERGVPVTSRPATRKIAAGVAGLLVIAVIGLLLGLNALGGGDKDPSGSGVAPGGGATNAPAGGGDPNPPGGGQPQKFPLTADQVRVVDPPKGDRQGVSGVEKILDGDPNTGWETSGYNSADFGNLKDGMGILINLGQPRTVQSIKVTLSDPGVSAKMLMGTGDPGATSAGDDTIVKTFQPVGEQQFEQYNGTIMTFNAFEPDQKYQYLLFFMTEIPDTNDGRYPYKIGVQEIEVAGLS